MVRLRTIHHLYMYIYSTLTIYICFIYIHIKIYKEVEKGSCNDVHEPQKKTNRLIIFLLCRHFIFCAGGGKLYIRCMFGRHSYRIKLISKKKTQIGAAAAAAYPLKIPIITKGKNSSPIFRLPVDLKIDET